MAERRLILDLENTLYDVRRNRLGSISGVRGLAGEKMIVSDFDGAPVQVATVDAAPGFARAVLEKQLRENGEIETGGRVIILSHRRKSNQLTELLYIATPGKAAVEKELERESADSLCLLFPVQKLLSNVLDALKPPEPVAILLMHDRHVDTVVADRRNLYGAFRVSAYRADSDNDLLQTNLDSALSAVERDNNIRITKIQCQHLLVPQRDTDQWVEALASRRGIPCRRARLTEVLVDGHRAFSSCLKSLRDLRPADSCSPSEIVASYRMNRLLPAAAAVLMLGCTAAFAAMVDREYRATRIAADIEILEHSLRRQIGETAPSIPDYVPHLNTATALAYAREIPPLHAVLGDISRAARGDANRIDDITLDYQPDRILVNLQGSTGKSQGSDSMALYNQFVGNLRRVGYSLADSKIDTDTQRVRFRIQLIRVLGERPA